MNKRKNKRPRKHIDIRRTLIALTVFVILFVILAAAVTPARYDIQVGQPAPNTIKATKDVVDLVTTEKLRDEAAAAVKSVYYVDEAAVDTVRQELEDMFREIHSVAVLMTSGNEITEVQLAGANDNINGIEISLEELKTLAEAGEEEIIRLSEDTIAFTTGVMSGTVGENQLEAVTELIKESLLEQGHSENSVEIAMLAVNACIKPNYFYDKAATEAARQAERDKVAEVSRIKGEVIVSDGEKVTEAQYAMLNQLGMIEKSTMDMWLYAGMALISAALVSATALYINMFAQDVYFSQKKLIELSAICVIVIALCILARTVNAYLMPVTLGVIMIAVLLGRKLALFLNIVLAIVASLMGSASGSFFNMATFSVMISALIAAVIALKVLRRRQTRLGVLIAGVAVGVVNIVVTFAVGLISSSNIVNLVNCALYAGLNGIIAAAAGVALIPMFELLFNSVTSSRLIELSNPNQPLIRRLLLEAPGTYHHSIIVANLAEAAAGSVGANGLLARVGAYYHDVGKLKRPMYFKENQINDNPHDRTDPRVSAAIILAHPKDGLELLKQYRIPEEVQEIVVSHHGDTPVLYFYNKSKEQNPDVNIEDYRYEGPRPKSREAAIVMLADTVEAAARTLPNPTVQSLRELIDKLIQGKLNDGQLNECELTFADLGNIIDAFVTVLSGAFHERIEYPNVEIPRRETK